MQFLVVHLAVLLYFLFEIAGSLRKLGKRGDLELPVIPHGRTVQRTFPAALVFPAVKVVSPAGAVGMDAATHREVLLVQLEHADVAELIAVGIEELVVVDIVVLAENPLAVRAEIGLCGFAFDLVMERFLPLVGVRKIELVGKEEPGRNHGSGENDRVDDAINAGPRRFDGGDFVGALHQAEGHQNCQQHDQRCDVVQQIRSDIEQVLGYEDRRNPIAENIAQEFKQSEYQDQDEEGRENHRQIDEEISQDIVVDQGGKAGAEYPATGGNTFKGVLGTSHQSGLQQGRMLLARAPPRPQLERTLFGAEEQEEPQRKE